MANRPVMPKIRAWMEDHPAPATISEIARGAGVSRPSVNRFLRGLTPAGLAVTGPPGPPRYQLRAAGSFEYELAEAARAAPLDEALAGLKRIAEAAGIFEQTWQASSIGEVCDMIARWCEIRRGLRSPERGFTAGHERGAAGTPAAALKAALATCPLSPPADVFTIILAFGAGQLAAGGPMWRLRCSPDIAQAHRFPGAVGVEVMRDWLSGRWELLDAAGGVIVTPGAGREWPPGATVEYRAGEGIEAGQVVEDHLSMARPWRGGGPVLGRAVTSAACNEQVQVIIGGEQWP